MLWFLNDRRTHTVSYFILGVSPYLQSRSINRLLPLVLIYIYTGVIIFFFNTVGGMYTKKEVLSDKVKFIMYFVDILARMILRILVVLYLPSSCEV